MPPALPVLAHGLGDADLLPVPLPVVLLAVGGAVAIAGRAPARRGAGPLSGEQPTAEAHWASVPQVLTVPRLLGATVALGLLGLALLGPADPRANPAPRLLYSVAWPALLATALVAPGAWRAANPVRLLVGGLDRAELLPTSPTPTAASGDGPRQVAASTRPGGEPHDEASSWVPAAWALGGFSAAEALGPAEPLGVVAVVLGVAVLGAVAALRGGWAALGRCDPFEVAAAVVGRCSPVTRDGRGRLRLASPGATVAAPLPAGGAGVVAVLVGAALADFARDTPQWVALTTGLSASARAGAVLASLGLGVGVAALGWKAARPLPAALVPLVLGYSWAHYLGVALIEGQVAFAQSSDLLDPTAVAAGPGALRARYDLLPGTAAALLQLAGFLLPHLLAVRAGVTRAGGGRLGRARTVPLQAVVVVSALLGVALRYG